MSRASFAMVQRTAVLLLVLSPGVLTAQDLGRVEFANSGAAAAQEPFLTGVLLLHSFEYERAAQAFRHAQEIDPDFALAYWGEAMTYNHPVWNQQDRAAARVALDRFPPEKRLATTLDFRERMYLDAIEILYGEGSKERRDTLYAEAMERLVDQYPDDAEAKAFYALALLGLSQGERNVPTYMRAAAVALEVFDRNPLHPGAAHYVIHSFDDPTHAPLGLTAARAYAKIAPDAPHAQHMTTHIFVAMGLWDDVVSQNTVASGAKPWRPGHYTSWLGYGYLQQGRFTDAENLLNEVWENLGEDPPPGRRAYLADMRAHFIVNTEQWDTPMLRAGVELADVDFWGSRGRDVFISFYAAIKRGEHVDRERAVAAMQAAQGDDRSTGILLLELQALLALENGQPDKALRLMREATQAEDTMPFEFGPPVVVKPSHELFGEILLDLGRASDAQQQFERALQLAPKRALALRGLGRAAAAAGDRRMAQRAYQTLLSIWHRADANMDVIVEAEKYLGAARVSERR